MGPISHLDAHRRLAIGNRQNVTIKQSNIDISLRPHLQVSILNYLFI